MEKVVIASNNPVKIKSTREGFAKMFPDRKFEFESINVPSGVSNQPITDHETLLGATNRAKIALEQVVDADFAVGIEGGVENCAHGMQCFAWIVVISRSGMIGRGKTGSFFLPPVVAKLVEQGMELGSANDQVFNESNSKQKGGSVGSLTAGAIDRTDFYIPAVVFALIPFKNKGLYQS